MAIVGETVTVNLIGPKALDDALEEKADLGPDGKVLAAQLPPSTGTPGADGDSAYEVAQELGFVGDQAAWLLSLKGPKGDKGDTGPAGADGTGSGGTANRLSRNIYWDGSKWVNEDGTTITSRPVTGLPVTLYSTKNVGVPYPTWMVEGDMRILHPDDEAIV